MNSGNGQRVAVPPVAGRVHQDALGSVQLDHVRRAGGSALAERVKRHPDPVPGVERQADRVFLDMVDADPLGLDPGVVADHIQDHPRPLVFVRQVRRVDQHQLIGPPGKVEVIEKHRRFVPRVLVQTNLADPENPRLVEKLGDQRDHRAGELDILGLLGVDAKPGLMVDPVQGGPLPFKADQLAKVVAKPFRPRPVKTRPERRLADQDTTGQRHPLVVVGGPADHVDVGIDVTHQYGPDLRESW